MVLDSGNFQFLTDLDPVLETLYYQAYGQHMPMLLNSVIGARTLDKESATDKRLGSLGDPQAWQGQVHYSDVDPDYSIVYTPIMYTNGFKMSQQMFEDNQFSGILDSAANLGVTFARHRIKSEADLFNNAFTTAGYDSVSLVNASHPRSSTDATTVSNTLGTKALTSNNLEDAIVQLKNLGDDRGELTSVMPNLLLVGQSQRKTAHELVESAMTPENANNASNVHMGMQYMVHPYITGKKWFVLDTTLSLQTIKWFDRILPQFNSNWDNGNTLVRSWWGRMRYVRGWSDWRAVVGSNPS